VIQRNNWQERLIVQRQLLDVFTLILGGDDIVSATVHVRKQEKDIRKSDDSLDYSNETTTDASVVFLEFLFISLFVARSAVKGYF
jgi:hypothetical protein